jgi:hypothetical protein
MPIKLPPNSTPATVADAWAKEVLEPAVKTLSGRDGRVSRSEASNTAALSGPSQLAADNIADVFAATGVSTIAAVSTMVTAGRALALEQVTLAAGADGKLSAAEMRGLGALQADLEYLTTPEVSAPRYSESVARSVMTAYGLSDLAALLARAAELDNGNGYLARGELEAAARALTPSGPEVGIVTDIDQTVIPKHTTTPPAPYPGVAALFRELEFRNGGAAGDMHYVTARKPERVVEMPDYFKDHALPGGTIDTGLGGIPWVAEKEKIKDITALMQAHPGQKFVLVGDSTQRDPEVYRAMQKAFPDQVAAVLIHNTAPISAARTEGQSLINNYAEGAATLFKQGVIDEAAARRVISAARTEGLALTDAQVEALLR